MSATDKVFAGSIPGMYDKYMGPMLFEPYAEDMAARAARLSPGSVLETAAGTGIVTARLVRQLAPGTAITATDLNPAMLDVAASKFASRAVSFRAADAMNLPFDADSFDAVICQFGTMFFPDKLVAFKEAKRVLRSGGHLLFSVWGNLATNPVAEVINDAMGKVFPDNPAAFFARMPHGYWDIPAIRSTLASAGFTTVSADELTLPSTAPDPHFAAVAMCQGSPLRNEIEARAPGRLDEITAIAAEALTRHFGAGPLRTTMKAIVFDAS